MLRTDEILNLIENDLASTAKGEARKSNDYYEGRHDIKDYNLYYFDEESQTFKQDKSRSNIKISHPFFTELVDQQVQYMLSKKADFVKSDIPELQAKLDECFGEDFISELYETVVDTVVKGKGYLYAYRNEDDKISFQSADSMGIIECDARDTTDGNEYIIYYYNDYLKAKEKTILRVQVWDNKQVTYYRQNEKGKLIFDESKKLNPRPHVIYKHEDDEEYRFYDEFGFIPFFRLDNNRNQTSNLAPIKDLIDDYDLMSCGLSNNLQDANEYLVVVKGFQGDNMENLINNVKVKKHIGVDAGGDIDFRTVSIPYEARRAKLELDEVNIYRFGMGFNSAQVGDGNVTNVVIKSRYALLDLKCNKLEIRLKKLLRKIVGIVLDEINEKDETAYRQKDVYFDFEREIITNASDNAQIKQIEAQTRAVEINTLLNVAGSIGNEKTLEAICELLEIDYEDVKSKLEKQEEIESEYPTREENARGIREDIPRGTN